MHTARTQRVPHLTLRPPSRWEALNLRDLWLYRDLLFSLAGRDVKLRYKQTLLGVAWVVLQPLIGAAIFTFVFGLLADMPSEGVPYFVFAFAGMIGWNVFSQVLNQSSVSLVNNSQLISKVFFPRLILPFSTVFSALIDFAIGLAMLIVLLFALGINPGPAILLLPVWIGLLFLFGVSLGLLNASLMVSYRDIRYVLPVAVQFLLYASPVGYGLAVLGEKVPEALHSLYMLNPLASLLEAVRWSLLGTGELYPGYLAYSVAVVLVALVAGMTFFTQMERKFADVI